VYLCVVVEEAAGQVEEVSDRGGVDPGEVQRQPHRPERLQLQVHRGHETGGHMAVYVSTVCLSEHLKPRFVRQQAGN